MAATHRPPLGFTPPELLAAILPLCLFGLISLVQPALGEPSNAAELAAKKSAPTYDLAADARRKAGMPPDEAAWETTLEQNLGPFYLPIYKQEKLADLQNKNDVHFNAAGYSVLGNQVAAVIQSHAN